MYRNVAVCLFTLVLLSMVCGATEETMLGHEAERYQKLTHELIAPCCWQEPIAIHRSPIALQMLGEVRRLILAGRTDEEIKAIYIGRYGIRILADPPGKQGMLLNIVPFAVLAAAGVGLWLLLRSFLNRVTPPSPRVPLNLIDRVRNETRNEWGSL